MKRVILFALFSLLAIGNYSQSPVQIKHKCPASSVYASVMITAAGDIVITPCPGKKAQTVGLGTPINLLSTATVNTNVGTKQTLYTVPVGYECYITQLIIKKASASLAAYNGAVSFGFDAGSTGWAGMPTNQIAILDSISQIPVFSIDWSAPMPNQSITGVGNDTFGVKFGDTSIIATVQIDVLGYLIKV